jgi:hypothetical protein
MAEMYVSILVALGMTAAVLLILAGLLAVWRAGGRDA